MKYGLHIHVLNYEAVKQPVNWPETPETIWRTLDAGLGWGAICPERNMWLWQRMDNLVSQCLRRGKHVWHALYHTPAWIASTQNPGGYGPGSESTPVRMDLFEQYLRVLVTRYKGRIKYYEGVNEWGRAGQTVDEAVEMQRILFDTVRAIDPYATVIGAPSPDVRKFAEIAPRIAPYCHAFAHHFYEHWQPLEEQFSQAAEIAGNKPLWNSECGRVDAIGHGGGINFRDMPDGERCAYLRHMDALCRAAKLEGWILHSWNGIMGFEGSPTVVDEWARIAA